MNMFVITRLMIAPWFISVMCCSKCNISPLSFMRTGLLVLTGLLAGFDVAIAEVITVCQGGGCNSTTIQDGLNRADDGDVVLVSVGTYVPLKVIDFQGKSVILRGESSSLGMATISGGNTRQIMSFVTNEGAGSRVENIRFTSGRANRGGAVYCLDAGPVFSNCVFDNNEASYRGGAVYTEGGAPRFENCEFRFNVSDNYGGGLDNTGGSTTVVDCVFLENVSNYEGGGIVNLGGDMVLQGVDFIGNTAFMGGGIWSYTSCSPSFEDCRFVQNQADIRGGGFHNDLFSVPSIRNCSFIDNSAGDGGAIGNEGRHVYLENTEICGNSPEQIQWPWTDGGENRIWVECLGDCPGDFDDDGLVGGGDMGLLLGYWGNHALFPTGDLNGDQVLDAADLGLLLGYWGKCP